VGDASLDDAVTSITTKRNTTEDVGSLSPNNYGLYDTRGNVREWCFEWAENKKNKMLLGGSWTKYKPEVLETSYRGGDAPSYHNYDIGFRCVVVPVP